MLITVNSSAALTTALNSAHAGDTIQLAAGTYSSLDLRNYNFSSDVTITSQDKAHEAVLTGLSLKSSTGLTFSNLEWQVDPAGPATPFQILSSTNVKLDHLNVHGSMDGTPQNDTDAIMIRGSTNVTVSNSEFQQLKTAVGHLDNTGLTVTGNYFHDIRLDGVHGGGSSNVKIADNYFTTFFPKAGDHADAVQFWTTNTTTSAHDITVTNNVVMRGGGGLTQGIFFRDEVGGLPFQNVNISGNLVVGGMYNGITVAGGDHVSITGNTVAGIPDQVSWIDIASVDHATLSNNNATQFLQNGDTNVTETNDHTIAMAADGGKALLAAWLASHPGLTDLPSAVLHSNAADLAVAVVAATKAQVVTVNGTAAADHLSVDGAHNSIVNGGDGADLIYGGGVGDNTLVGGAGDDTYYVKSSLDTVVEQANGGNDVVSSSDDYVLPDNVEVLRLTGTDGSYGAGNGMDNKINGSGGDDSLFGMGGNDNVTGGAGNDFVSGGDGNDVVGGDAGADTIVGDAGNDSLNGDDGNDVLSGGDGTDRISGGTGADTMTGGAGADSFVFRPGDVGFGATADRITDFSTADGDKIDLNALDAKSATTANDAFTFIGALAFHKVAGELRFEVQGHDTVVMGDTNGDGVADFTITLSGVYTLHSSDFFV